MRGEGTEQQYAVVAPRMPSALECSARVRSKSSSVVIGSIRLNRTDDIFCHRPDAPESRCPRQPTKNLQEVLRKIIRRVLKRLPRRGALVEEEDAIYVADDDGDSDDARTLRPMQAAACTASR